MRSANSARARSRPVPGRRPPTRTPAGRLHRSSASILRRLDALPASSATDPRTCGRHQLVLVTFRHNGRPVASPVWAATDGELVYVRTRRASGKVKRLRGNNCALLAPCTFRGKPKNAAVPARVRLLPPAEEHLAERQLREKCGRLRAAVTAVQNLLRADTCYLAIELDQP